MLCYAEAEDAVLKEGFLSEKQPAVRGWDRCVCVWDVKEALMPMSAPGARCINNIRGQRQC